MASLQNESWDDASIFASRRDLAGTVYHKSDTSGPCPRQAASPPPRWPQSPATQTPTQCSSHSLPPYIQIHSLLPKVNDICVVLQLPQWKMSSDSQATLVTSQHYVWGWQWRSIRVHNPAVPFDWVLAATTMTTVWTTVRLFSCMGQEMAL